jgi:hypothetical protein
VYPKRRAARVRAGLAVSAVAGIFALGAGYGLGAGRAEAATGDRETTPHESFIYMSCEGTPCQRQMYRVPDNQRLKVFALSCAAQVRVPGAVSHIGLRRRLVGGGEEVVDMASNRVGVQGETQYFAFRAGPETFVDSGDTVNAFVDSTAEVDAFYCFLAGDLIDVR